jgi:hypothetical protein
MSLNSVIMTKVRPTMIFDVTNKEHRRHAWVMIKKRSLKDSPYIWALNEGQDNVFDMIYHRMVEWYADQEFGVVEQPQPEKVVPITGVDRKQV